MRGALEARAPGKVILFGEYAVLEGGTAVVAAVERHARCEVDASEGGPQVAAPEITDQIAWPGRSAASGDPLAFVQQLLDRWPQEVSGLFSTYSGALYSEADGVKLGLGSSAAASTALAGAMAVRGGEGALLDGEDASEWPLRQSIFERVQGAHRAVQGAGSGADVAAAVMGGVITYTLYFPTRAHLTLIRADLQPQVGDVISAFSRGRWPVERPLLMAWTGQAASTKALIPQVRALEARDAGVWRQRMGELSQASEAGSRALEAADDAALLEAVVAGAEAVEALARDSGAPLILPAHGHIADIARAHGGAAKPTGAAGGDLAWVLPPSPEAIEPLRHALTEAGFYTVALPVCRRGLHVRPLPV